MTQTKVMTTQNAGGAALAGNDAQQDNTQQDSTQQSGDVTGGIKSFRFPGDTPQERNFNKLADAGHHPQAFHHARNTPELAKKLGDAMDEQQQLEVVTHAEGGKGNLPPAQYGDQSTMEGNPRAALVAHDQMWQDAGGKESDDAQAPK